MTDKDVNKGSMFSKEEREQHINEEQIYLQQYHAGNPIPLREFWDSKRNKFLRIAELRSVNDVQEAAAIEQQRARRDCITAQGEPGADFGAGDDE